MESSQPQPPTEVVVGGVALANATLPEKASGELVSAEMSNAQEVDTSPAVAPALPLPKANTAIRYRWLPDLIKVVAAASVIVIAAFIWWQPPLAESAFPHLSYVFEGKLYQDATLYRPAAMPSRYYVALPRKLAGHYKWFAIDRRREVVALTEAPGRSSIGGLAIRRNDPLGLDLEFRKIDGSEWQIYFLDDRILFSNAVLAVTLDTKK